jgi:lipopolysaccharide biosynthesis glycosyltransferase
MLIDVVCTIDNSYARHCAVMLASLFKNNLTHSFRIHVITDGLESQILEKFEKFLSSSQHSHTIITIDKSDLENAPVTHHISLATYFRLLIPQVLPADISKVLFLDADMIIRQSIGPLWNLDIEQFSHAAAISAGMDTYEQELGLLKGCLYFNAGMMLINLKKWRELEVFERSCDLIRNQPGRLKWWDQDTLNLLLHDRWRPIDLTWNAQPFIYGQTMYGQTLNETYEFHHRYQEFNYLQAVTDPAIVHYVGGGSCKPWHYYCQHPFRDDYLKFQALTPWRNAPLIGIPNLVNQMRWKLKFSNRVHKFASSLSSLT